MTKMAGSGAGSESGSESISQMHGSADPDPDPPQNFMDPQPCEKQFVSFLWFSYYLDRYITSSVFKSSSSIKLSMNYT
jgi:hypothetical protein